MEELTKFTRTIKLTGTENILVASMNLPLVPYKQKDGKWSLQMSAFALYSGVHSILSRDFPKARWVGFCDIPKSVSESDRREIELLLNKRRCYPIFLDPAIKSLFFTYYENVLYPFFHNFVEPTDNFSMLRPEHWETFCHVNKLFAEEILVHLKPNTLIWLNDMHLLMCPLQIVLNNPYANIGLFVHTSFPSAELFKVFPQRTGILQSMLCCNIVGFHAFTYARHFLIACRRILGIEHKIENGFIFIESCNRKVMVKVDHGGIDINFVEVFFLILRSNRI